MKRHSAGFFQGLKRSNLRLCLCWRIETMDGNVLGFTEHDKEIVVDGETYTPTNAFSSSAMKADASMSVNNINVVALMSDEITEEDLHAGRYDDAMVRIFYVQWDQPNLGILPLMNCQFGEIKFFDGEFETELRSRMQRLQQDMGRVYNLECDAILGDDRCRADLSIYPDHVGSISAINEANRTIIYDQSLDALEGFYQYGLLTFTSGKNTGRAIEVRGNLGNAIILIEPPAFRVQKGDEFTLQVGCDHTPETCKSRFNNYVNYRGFPDMPTEQTATETPNAK